MQVNEVQQDSVRDSIVQAMAEIEEKSKPEVEAEEDLEAEVEVEAQDTRPRDEKGKFKAKDAQEEAPQVVEAPEVKAIEPPQALSGAIKAKWNELPDDVKAEWRRREDDIHKMATSHDAERKLGRDIKDVITPYMPIITAEGGNPISAVQSLLNTAYLLRTGTPEKKAELVRQIAQQYGVDLGQAAQAPQVDPVLSSVQQELQQLKQFFTTQQQTQEQAQQQQLLQEIQAFAADPKHPHFEQVKSLMAPLLASGQAKDLQEAYDMACHANPSIRSTILQAQDAEKKAKQKAELEAKKKAAVSVTGSPGVTTPNASPNRDLRDELRANLAAARGAKI